LQDWDAIYAYSYAHSADEFDVQKIPSFFDIGQHPLKMASLLSAAALFRRGDVLPAREQIVVPLDPERELDLLRRAHPWTLVDARHLGVKPELALVHRVALKVCRRRSVITATELQPGRWLITALGYAENTGMGWTDATKTSVGRNWGKAPSLVEGVSARLTFPGKFELWALDERGQRREKLPGTEIGPQFKTIWYEVAPAP